MIILAWAHHAVIGGAVIAAFVIGAWILLGVAGRERGSHRRNPTRLERKLAAAAIEDAMVRAQAKSSDDEGAAS